MSRQRGFFLAEAAVACFVAAIFLAAVFSSLFISGAVLRKLEQRMERERSERTVPAGYASAVYTRWARQ